MPLILGLKQAQVYIKLITGGGRVKRIAANITFLFIYENNRRERRLNENVTAWGLKHGMLAILCIILKTQFRQLASGRGKEGGGQRGYHLQSEAGGTPRPHTFSTANQWDGYCKEKEGAEAGW